MDRANNLTVKITGKNQRGEAFEDFARVESFGSFGMLVHTSQTFALSDVLHICGGNGKPIASAEVIWVRGGESPAVEILLHRNLNLEELTASLVSLSPPAAPVEQAEAARNADSIPTLRKSASSAPSSLSTASASISRSSVSESPVTNSAADDEQINCPSCNKPNPVNAKSCKFCGVYITRSVSRSVAQEVRDSKSISTDSIKSLSNDSKGTSGASTPKFDSTAGTTPAPESRRMQREREREREERPTQRTTNQATAKSKEQQQALQQYRKIAIAALLVLVFLLAATFFSGFGLVTSTPTKVEVVLQSGCLDVNALRRPPANAAATGDLEIWTESDNGAVQILRREITAGDASKELDVMARSGLKIHGNWCPKYESKPADGGEGQLPGILTLPWLLKPVGANASTIGELTMQTVEKTLVIKEKVNGGATLDRTKDIKQATYYNGMQKIVVKFDDTTAKVDGAVLREITFYLPSGQDPGAAAQGLLTNTIRPYYLARPDVQQASTFSFILIIQIILGVAIAITLGYLIVNLARSRKV